jgi:CDP-diacylglycerol--glycerol-3-phosphate 3-phosphatidyltransferase
MDLPPQVTTLPNLLTIGRIIAVPVICLLVVISSLSGWFWLRWLVLLIYIAAAFTDWLDGFLARRMHLNSALGRMLDPIADKLLVGGLLITLAWTDLTAWDLIPAIAILLREIFVSGLREYLGKHDIVVSVTMLAKWKTTVQLVALGCLIIANQLLGLGFFAHFLLWIAAFLTVWTGWDYLRSSWPYLAGPEEEPPPPPESRADVLRSVLRRDTGDRPEAPPPPEAQP